MKGLFLVAVLFTFFAATAQPRFIDSTFGTNGTIVQNTGLSNKDVTDVVLQQDGKSVTLAGARYNLITRVVLIRYNTDGTLDASFSGNGIADSLITPGIECYPSAIKVQPDGKLLICGYKSDRPNAGFVIRYNTDGSFDASFATNGILYLPNFTIGNTTNSISSISDLVVLPNNKLMLLAGYNNTDTTTINLKLIQLNPTGTIDSSFGTNGTVWFNTSFSPWSVTRYNKILLQTDGKYVVGSILDGYSSPSATADLVLVRVNANGTIDNTYGTNGIATPLAGQTNYNLKPKDMALQSDGRIIVSGTGSTTSANYGFTYATRVTTSGTLDASFAGSGIQYLFYTSSSFVSNKGQVSLQADGKILLAGNVADAVGNNKMAVARLTTAGILDATFGGNGIATLQINQYSSYGIASVQQGNGSIIISGYANNNNAASVAIARLTAGGQTDNTVATAANIAYIGTENNYEAGLNVHIQPADQKVVDIKSRYDGATYDLRVSRYLPDGTPDATFGTGGHTIIELPGSSYGTYSSLLSNGKLMIVCGLFDYISSTRTEMVRVNANGTVDSSFGLNGKFSVPPVGNGDILYRNLYGVVFQPDDKVLLLTAQHYSSLFPDSFFLTRLNPNGSLDVTFNNTGHKYLTPSSFLRIALQTTGKMIMVERRNQGTNTSFVVNRINANGSLDNTFNGGNTVLVPFITSLQNWIVQPDDKIVLSDYQNIICRLGSNGRPDSTFGVAGRVDITAYSSYSSYFSTIYALDSGRLLIITAGPAYPTNGSPFIKIVKLQSNGQPDSSFGINAAIQVNTPNGISASEMLLAVQADGKLLLTGSYYSSITSTNYGDAALTRLKPTAPAAGRRYTFTGSGLWSNSANWSDGTVPPTTLPDGSSVVIDPPTGSECVIDITVHVQIGATLTVKAGKQVRLLGNLIIQ